MAKRTATTAEQRKEAQTFTPEEVALAALHPHPRNYQAHPDDELAHIMESITTHGFYRNVVIARDNTILAGHGVVQAARKLGYTSIPAVRVDYAPDDPRALKLLAGDNEIRHLAEVDDRALSELLRELNESAVGLLGTGYDELMLANLTMVSRPAAEIADLEAAAQWVGMPEYDERGDGRIQLIVNFVNEDDLTQFYHLLGLDADAVQSRGATKFIWWPKPQQRNDLTSARFTEDTQGDADA